MSDDKSDTKLRLQQGRFLDLSFSSATYLPLVNFT